MNVSDGRVARAKQSAIFSASQPFSPLPQTALASITAQPRPAIHPISRINVTATEWTVRNSRANTSASAISASPRVDGGGHDVTPQDEAAHLAGKDDRFRDYNRCLCRKPHRLQLECDFVFVDGSIKCFGDDGLDEKREGLTEGVGERLPLQLSPEPSGVYLEEQVIWWRNQFQAEFLCQNEAESHVAVEPRSRPFQRGRLPESLQAADVSASACPGRRHCLSFIIFPSWNDQCEHGIHFRPTSITAHRLTSCAVISSSGLDL